LKTIKPNINLANFAGILLIIWPIYISIFLLRYLEELKEELVIISIFFWLSILLSYIYLIYTFVSFLSLKYLIERNGLHIKFGIQEYIIPLNNIQSIIEMPSTFSIDKQKGIKLMNFFTGRIKYEQRATLSFLSKAKNNTTILIKTINRQYLISVPSYKEFRESIAMNRIIGQEIKKTEATYKKAGPFQKIISKEYLIYLIPSCTISLSALIIGWKKSLYYPELIKVNFPFNHFNNLQEYIDLNTIFNLNRIIIIVFLINSIIAFIMKYLFNYGYKSLQLITMVINVIILVIFVFSIKI
jgi:hypothetical protein